jgi:hypothetical protein
MGPPVHEQPLAIYNPPLQPMNTTTEMLFVVHRGPTAKLQDICDKYLNLAWNQARAKAALNQLPFPTFRLTESVKSPLMVYVKDLAAHIDTQHALAEKEWEKSQV